VPKKKRAPYLYVDTNVFLDVVWKRRESSIVLVNRIKTKKIKACTSTFTFLEATDKEQEYKFFWKMLGKHHSFDEILRLRFQRQLTKQDLEDVIETVDAQFWKPYKDAIDFYYLELDGWTLAMELMGELSIRSNDVIHLATAILAGCDLFVTNDTDLLKTINKKIPACTPEQVDQKLKSLGFKILT